MLPLLADFRLGEDGALAVNQCFCPLFLEPAVQAAAQTHALVQKLCFHDTANFGVALQIYFYFELLKRTDETQMRALVLNAQTYGTRFGGFDRHFLALPASLSDYYADHATPCLLYAFSLKDVSP